MGARYTTAIFAAKNADEQTNESGCKRNDGRREAADAHIAEESSTAIVRRMAGCRVTTHRLSSKVSWFGVTGKTNGLLRQIACNAKS